MKENVLPTEYKMLQQAKRTLKPYWEITDRVWSMYPKGSQELSDQIALIENTNPAKGKALLKKYPAILRARELVAEYKKQLRSKDKRIDLVLRIFYAY